MTAPACPPDFRHLTLWPATGARYGDGTLIRHPTPPRCDDSSPARTAESRYDASPATQV